MQKSRPRRKGKKANVRLALDAVVREQLYERDGHRCVRCGTRSGLTPSHVFPKGRYSALRWDLDNLLTLCVACHLYWWHLEPVASGTWFRKNWPERYEKLWQLANTTQKVNPKELLKELTGE